MRAARTDNAFIAEVQKIAFALFVFGAIVGAWFVAHTILARYAKLPDAKGGPCTLWFVGSSTIHKWKSLESDMMPWTAYNRGRDGATAHEIAQMFANDTVGRSPFAIILYIGDNDIAAGDDVGRIMREVNKLVLAKRKLYSNTPVYILSVKPSPERLWFLPEQRELNRRLSTIAGRSPDMSFIGVAGRFFVDGQPGDFYVSDGVHLNSAGYAVLSRGVREKLTTRRSEPTFRQCSQRRRD